MYVSRVRVDGIKGFTGPRTVDLTLTRPDGSHAGWTVIAGRNGSGKTTLLRAIALAVHGEKAALRLLSDREWISGELPSGGVAVDVTGPNPDDGGFPEHRLAEIHWAATASGPEIATPVGVSLRKIPPILCAAYGPFRRLSGRQISDKPSVARATETLFDEDASLVSGVEWLIRQHLRSLEKREAATALKSAALDILSDGLLPDGYRVVEVDSEGLWVTKGQNRFALEEMSDGYRTVTALVVDLLKQIDDAYGLVQRSGATVTAPGIVLIDEVDAHLHVSWQKRIGGWLTTHFPNIQFIVTTHSPYVCQSADPGGLIQLPGPDEEAAPRVVDEDLYRRVVYGSGDDAALTELFGLESTYSDRARELRRELVQLEAAVLAGTANQAMISRYGELKATLSSSLSAQVDEAVARWELPQQ